MYKMLFPVFYFAKKNYKNCQKSPSLLAIKKKVSECFMNKKRTILILCIFIIGIVITFFIKNNYKILKFGNNINSKSIEEMEEYILNISSYEANLEVTITSNKNENKYILNQKCGNDNVLKQEIIEPSNIQGLQTIYNEGKLEIKNSKLGLTTILENYPYVTENVLWLSSFVKDYKESTKKSIKEEDNMYVMEVTTDNSNEYMYSKILYIDKKTNKPSKMLIKDKNNKTLIYILYNKINFDSLSKEEVLAFQLDYIELKDL